MSQASWNPIVEGDSKEAVAFALLASIASAEGKSPTFGVISADKQWVLQTYADCLDVVKGGPPPA